MPLHQQRHISLGLTHHPGKRPKLNLLMGTLLDLSGCTKSPDVPRRRYDDDDDDGDEGDDDAAADDDAAFGGN